MSNLRVQPKEPHSNENIDLQLACPGPFGPAVIVCLAPTYVTTYSVAQASRQTVLCSSRTTETFTTGFGGRKQGCTKFLKETYYERICIFVYDRYNEPMAVANAYLGIDLFLLLYNKPFAKEHYHRIQDNTVNILVRMHMTYHVFNSLTVLAQLTVFWKAN